jgi:hypothetical protein
MLGSVLKQLVVALVQFVRFHAAQKPERGGVGRYDLLDDKVKFLKGWFRDTLHVAPIRELALLRLDGDRFESTMDSLKALYDKVSPGAPSLSMILTILNLAALPSLGPRDRFEKILERTHGGLIVEQYRTALLYLVPNVRLVVAISH